MTMTASRPRGPFRRPKGVPGRLFPTPEQVAEETKHRTEWEAERARYKPGQKLPRRLRTFTEYMHDVAGVGWWIKRRSRMKTDAMSDSTFRHNRRLLGEIDAGKHDARLAREEAEWMIESECGQDDTLWHRATIIPSEGRLYDSVRFQVLALSNPRLWCFLARRRERAMAFVAYHRATGQMTLPQRIRMGWFDTASAQKMGHTGPLWSHVIEALRMVAHDGAHPASLWHLIPAWLREQLDRTRGLEAHEMPATMSDETADDLENIDSILDGLARREPIRRNPRGPHRHRTGRRLYLSHIPREMRHWEEAWEGDIAWWKKRAEAAKTILAGGYPEP